MKQIFCLYCHTNNINNKKYIGITCQKPQNRWGKNGKNYSKQEKFYNAIIKYGWDNFSHEILLNNLTREEAINYEQEYIKFFNTIKNGYNTDLGGMLKGTKQVRCLTTNEIFNSVSEAAASKNISPSNLSHCLRGDQDTAGKINDIKLEWCYIDINLNNYNHLNIKRLEKIQEKEQQKKELLEKAKEFFLQGCTITEIANRCNASKETISKLLKENGFEVKPIYETRKKKIDKYDKNYNYICTFESMTEALKSVNEKDNNISRLKKACEEEWRIFKGYHWKYH